MEICATKLPHIPRIWMCKRRFMAGVSYLPVFKDVYHLILKIFDYTNHFPRKYKFTLGQDLKRDDIILVRSMYRANKSKEKTPYLEAFLDDFELVKLELRLCADMKFLPLNKKPLKNE